MNIRNPILTGFSIARKQWLVAAMVYFFQSCLTLTLGMQVYSVWESSIGNSLEINKLLSQYDHTVLTDFLKVHGASITPLIGQLRWILLVWILFSVFINAGLLYVVSPLGRQEKHAVRAFWEGGARFFFPFLKISLFLLFLLIVWTVLVWFPVALFLESSLQYFPSEKYPVWIVIGLMLLYLLGLAVLFIWSVLSRFAKIRTRTSAKHSLRIGWHSFIEHKTGFLGLLLAFLLAQGVLLLIYWLLSSVIGMQTPLAILLTFAIQQIFVFFRIQLRQMMYAGIGYFSGSASVAHL